MKAFMQNFHEVVTTPKDVDKLKKLILQLAVQGKLVEQDPNDEPAVDLLKKINEEKTTLIKEKKIRKHLPLPAITNDEKPYQLPDGWKWVRLEEISEYIQRGKSPKYSDEKQVPVISQKCIQWTGFDLSKARFIDPLTISKYGDERFLQIGDLLWNSTGLGTLGRINVISDLDNYKQVVADSHVTVIRPIKKYICSSYLYLWFSSPFVQEEINLKSSGSTKQTELSTTTVKEYLVPVPSLNEQKRIVEKVRKLFDQCNYLFGELVKNKTKSVMLNKSIFTRLEDHKNPEQISDLRFMVENMKHLCNDKDSIAQLRNSVLSLAVQGKLVRQDFKEEPASILLKKIQEEKERLIADKKIKKEKTLQPINSYEVPFALPSGWEWVRLGSITTKLGAGKTPLGGEKNYVREGVKFIRSQNVWNNGLYLDGIAHITFETNESMNGSIVRSKDILINITGASIGRSSLVPDDFDIANVNQHVAIVRLVEDSIRHYIHTCIISPYFQNEVMRVQVGASREGLSMSKLSKFIIPLPPIEEQKRIITAVRNLFNLIDQYENQVMIKDKSTESLLNSFIRNLA